jgi:hypothetical protein
MTTDLDLARHAIINVRLQPLSSDPSNPVAGIIYLNTAMSRARYWTGSAWITIDASGGGGGTYLRTLGWYVESSLAAGDGIGPIYILDGNVTITGFAANAKITPTSTCTLDVQTSTNYTTWTTIFSVKPTIASGASIASAGTLSVTTLAAGTYIRWCVVTAAAAGSVTVQLQMTG